ncbi:hypothetical protein [Methylocystis iwaonis]|uniref:hypothetical protein n=1 Tax=Methylocystis iwaonis TaxID=2885079 RepID=UPI002E7C482D|nr:hypothetical protein [Methylocystis iwaonis]
MGAGLPIAEIAHAMPGRARLRFPDRLGDSDFFASVSSGLSALPGVYKVAARPFTGSVLIEHGDALEKVSEAALEAGLFAIGEARSATKTDKPVDLDPKALVALALVGLALWQVAREKFFPPAFTLLWYAGHLAGVWRSPESGDDAMV